MRPRWGRIALSVAVVAVLCGVVWAGAVIWSNVTKQPLPLDDQCRATASTGTVTVTPEQAVNATIITSVAMRRGLPARAVSIALATVYQESGMRNLDYGHADSVGLFQQRPSQGWGTVKQIMDPYYSAGKFYDELVKVKGWRTGDINDVAQKVQRSGHPQAYRKHVSKARVLASVLTGETPGGFSCTFNSRQEPDAEGLAALVNKAYKGKATAKANGENVVAEASSEPLAWALGNLAVAHTQEFGVSRVSVGASDWVHETHTLAPWTSIGGGRSVTIALRG